MTHWMDFSIYALLIFILWFVNPRALSRLAVPMLADRNAEWLAAHPEVVEITRKRRWHIRLYDSLGAVSLVVLVSLQLGFWFPAQRPGQPVVEPWMALWGVTIVLLIMHLLVIGAIGLYFRWIVRRHIPIAEKRQASLEPRSIGDFVPVWARISTYTLVIANLAAWIAVAALGWHNDPGFWPRLVSMFILSAIFYVAASAMVVRRPNAMDRIFGMPYRRSEVLFSFWAQLLTPLIGSVRLYEELTNTILFDVNRAMQLGLVVFIVVAFLRFARLTFGSSSLDEEGLPHTATR